MGSFLSCLQKPEGGEDERQPLLLHGSDVEEERLTSATQSTSTLPHTDSRTTPSVKTTSRVPPTATIPHATCHSPSQPPLSPAVAITQSIVPSEVSFGHPTPSPRTADHIIGSLAERDTPLVSSQGERADLTSPFYELDASGFDGLRSELQQNNRAIASMRTDVSTLAQVMGTASRNRAQLLIERLPVALNASYDEVQGCMKGTRTYIIGEGVNFLTREDVGDTRVYLLTGCAGSGKTAIAHSIARICHQDHKSLGASFIFEAGQSSRNTPKYLITTVARKLSHQIPAYASQLSTAIEANPTIAQAPLAMQFQTLLLHPISKIDSQSQPISIVIDAIDEGWSEPLLHVIKSFSKLPSWVRIFMTLRDDGFILPRLRSCSHIIRRNIDVKTEHNIHDIRVYIGERLRILALDRELQDWPGNSEVDELCSKADGLFVWAAVACNSIADADVDPKERYEELISDSPIGDPQAFHQMDRLYLKVLSKCCLDEPRALFRFHQCLGAILALKRPLSISAHNELLAIKHAQHTLRPVSPMLTNVDDPNGIQPIQIIHQSLREFLTRGTSDGSPAPKHTIIEIEHNESLALHCLALIRNAMPLLAEHTGWLKGLTEKTPYDHIQYYDIPTWPNGIVSEGVWYACEFLADHIHAVKREIPNLLSALAYFMQNDLYGWLAVCAMKGKIKGVAFLQQYTQWVYQAANVALDAASLSRVMTNLSITLSYYGRFQEALLTATESVSLSCALVGAQDSMVLKAAALENYSDQLSALGHHTEALLAARESLDLYINLAKQEPSTFLSELARSFDNLSCQLSWLDCFEEALSAAHKSVDTYRKLAEEQPAAFLTNLADSLINLSERLAWLDRHEESLAAVSEAVDICYELWREQPARFSVTLADSLNNLSQQLSLMNQDEAALFAAQDAVKLFRNLAGKHVKVSSSDFADSLDTLSRSLDRLDRHDEAVAAERESIDLYRHLASDQPEAFNPFLAGCLFHLARVLSQRNDHVSEAFQTCREAEELYRLLADKFPSNDTSEWKAAQDLLKKLGDAENGGKNEEDGEEDETASNLL